MGRFLGFLVLAGLVAGCAWYLLGYDGQTIRVYVEETYEQDRLQRLLAREPDVKVLGDVASAEVTLRVEAAPLEKGERLPRAQIRARHIRTGYEVYALAQFLPVRNGHGGRARWLSSYSEEIREDDIDAILAQVVREAAQQEHRNTWYAPSEVNRAMQAGTAFP